MKFTPAICGIFRAATIAISVERIKSGCLGRFRRLAGSIDARARSSVRAETRGLGGVVVSTGNRRGGSRDLGRRSPILSTFIRFGRGAGRLVCIVLTLVSFRSPASLADDACDARAMDVASLAFDNDDLVGALDVFQPMAMRGCADAMQAMAVVLVTMGATTDRPMIATRSSTDTCG